MTHTPTPWRVILDDSGGQFCGFPSIKAPDDIDKSVVHRAGFKQEFWGDWSEKDACCNAEFIVRAVNAHDAMLAALVACHSLIASEFGSAEASALEGHPIDKAARATWDAVCEAIALAEGKP